MEFIVFMAVLFLVVLGLMFAVSSEGKNPTPKQIANRIVWNRKVRKFKKMLAVDEVIAPFVAGVILIFALVVITFKIHGVI